MKKILILYPHFPPSNLAGVHRPRLFAKHLPAFGWEPTILTVHEDFYEEELDCNLVKLLPANLRIEKVKAFKVGGKVRLIGDIGLRAFFQLYKRAKQLIKTESFDFLYIPIPSFYCALLGRLLHSSTKIKYGIDYIDPWVHQFPGAEKRFSRHWWSMKLSGILEPIAIKKASLITGVAEGYYQGVIERNPDLMEHCIFGSMPYGGEEEDHKMVGEFGLRPTLFRQKDGMLQLVYAGAILPKAHQPLEEIFRTINANRSLFSGVEIHFIGTGKSATSTKEYNIKRLAEAYGLWQTVIFEYPARIPYLNVLAHLEASDGVFILGSTEPHYTPSKLYQAVLSKKPVLAILHEQSQACKILRQTGAGVTIGINESTVDSLHLSFLEGFSQFLSFQRTFWAEKVNRKEFRNFSAYAVTRDLVSLLEKIEK